MEAYSSFAQVYDLFMDNVPYEEWSRYLISLLKEYQVTDGTVVELGCGTGKMTRLLADAGYDMIGIDNSFDMLDMALEREDDRILYLMQDMREFEPGEKVSAVVSACDSINYILEPEDLQAVFFCVSESLKEGGIFIFDINTSSKIIVALSFLIYTYSFRLLRQQFQAPQSVEWVALTVFFGLAFQWGF